MPVIMIEPVTMATSILPRRQCWYPGRSQEWQLPRRDRLLLPRQGHRRQKFDGFYGNTDKNLDFLAEIGIDQAIQDWHAVVNTEIPDPVYRATKVSVRNAFSLDFHGRRS